MCVCVCVCVCVYLFCLYFPSSNILVMGILYTLIKANTMTLDKYDMQVEMPGKRLGNICSQQVVIIASWSAV